MELTYLRRARLKTDVGIVASTALRIFHRKAHENDSIVKDHLPAKEQKKFHTAAGQGD